MDHKLKRYIVFFILLIFNNVYSQNAIEGSNFIDSPEFEDSTYSAIFLDEYNDIYYEDHVYAKMGEINVITSFPLTMSNKGFYHRPTGVDLSYHIKIKDSQPVYFDFGLSYQWYGYSSLSFYDYGYSYPEEWKETWTNNFISFYLGSRYYLPKNIFFLQPYIGLDLKYRLLFAFTNLTNVEYAETVESDTKGANGNFGYSMTLGTLLNIDIPDAFVNFSLSFDSGGTMNYFIKNNDASNVFYVSDYYEKSYIPNSFLTLKLGMTFF
jgi:hypothetical protein